MNRCALVDPATNSRYVWAYNPNAVGQASSQRQVSELEPVAAGWGVPVTKTRQQGIRGPDVLSLAGTIGSDEQHAQFLRFERLSASQSVIFEHFTGQRFEVLIVSYEMTRQAALRGVARGDRALRTYRLDLEILNTL